MQQRTTQGVILFRYLLLGLPVALFVGFASGPVLLVLAVFAAVMTLTFFAIRFVSNCITRMINPDAFEAHKRTGGDPFNDSLGENSDT